MDLYPCFRAVALLVLLSSTQFLIGSRQVRGDNRTDNPLLVKLTEIGIDLGRTRRVALPSPTLPDGLGQEQYRQRLEPIHRRHGWERFTRNSQVAPFELKLGVVSDEAGTRIGHTVSVWFVAYGKLELLRDAHALDQLAASVRDDRTDDVAESDADAILGQELNDEQLAAAGVERLSHEGSREAFVEATYSVLNRIQVAGVARVVSSQTDRSLIVAWELDPRFAKLGSRQDGWRSMDRTSLGARKLGEWQTYQGYGGYGKITALDEPDGALLVECHVVMHEPEAWFAGSNALRAKIPLGIQENVRKFRRELARLELSRNGLPKLPSSGHGDIARIGLPQIQESGE